jgi:pentatricopeptide repeat protein
LCHVGEMKWAMKFMVRMKDDGCNVQS